MRLEWIYPRKWVYNTGHVAPVAELFDNNQGVRVAIVARSDDWPDTSYRVLVANEDYRFNPDDSVDMQGDFLQAQALALALAVVR